ncbi:hypothetical protein CTI12_AA358990 [Artemisia annua]|uniref:Pelota N-terminal domain-containing protein n=1 Tax=Artemisia annua TaxID=35608 RepID=A0A2U1MNE2_ARTAN|nr:hypothetical protein CTI12_AA358990 [Artemisia annua]
MKIVRRDYVPNGPGSVKIIPDESDDLWLAYNLIVPGDTVMAVTISRQNKKKKKHTTRKSSNNPFMISSIIPDESDDLWLAYNLIVPGDTVMAVTIRYTVRNYIGMETLITVHLGSC